VGDLFHRTGDKCGRALPSWLAQNPHSLAGAEGRLAHGIIGECLRDAIQRVIQSEVPRDPCGIALMHGEAFIFSLTRTGISPMRPLQEPSAFGCQWKT
jgi:hypothetical protein